MNAISGLTLVVGLVNNMAAAGAEAAAAQFAGLLAAAGGDRPVQVRRFAAALPGHEPLDALWHARLDGLIVTGAEPQASAIDGEPAWPLLSRLVDWAAANTRGSVWSCLAAHAVAHRLDRIDRLRLQHKISGVFDCRWLADSKWDQSASTWKVPHSRWNDLDPDAIAACGYDVLARGPAGWVDACTRSVGGSRVLLLQGHPEYDADTLLREYRRDVRRCLEADAPSVPSVPTGYFDPATEAALTSETAPSRLLRLLTAAETPRPGWRTDAVALFRAWLHSLDWPAALSAALAASPLSRR